MPNSGNKGAQRPGSTTSEYNAQVFLVQQILSRVSTSTLVKIVAVTNAGEISPVGFVDVLPLVNQLDGDDQAMSHQTVYGLPYFRMQGGANAVIIDPQIGDIGICLFADRDISKVKATKAQGNPGSKRRFNMSDGLYIGGVLNGTPERYVLFRNDGMTIKSPQGLTIDAETYLDGSLSVTGNVSVGTGASGTFTTPAGQTVTVQDGIITNIF